MILFAMIVLVAWMPFVVGLFSAFPPHRALIASFLISIMFVPGLLINLPGLPDYSKTTATSLGCLVGSLLFDSGRIARLRLRWFDLPVIGWCISPFATAISNDLGAYVGASGIVDSLVNWGLPYLLGRAYLTSPAHFRDLALGLVIGGLIYIPFCLYEIRFSPMLNVKLYGFATSGQGWEGMRYGGYRPRVFMAHGLELGMFYTLVMMVAYRSWAWGVIKTLGGWPFGMIVLALGLITILCKGTGAIMLLLVGLSILWASRVLNRSWLVWALVLLPFVYAGVRTTGVWSGKQATDLAETLFDGDRAFSIQTRFDNEVVLIDRALERPILGWGGFGRSRVHDENGKDIVLTDGMWIITFGVGGYLALVSLLSCYGLPIVVFLRRHPVSSWVDRDLVPAAAMAVTLGLYSIDNLSNALPTPINPLIAGGLVALPAVASGRGRSRLGLKRVAGDILAEEGRYREAAIAYREAITTATARDNAPTSYRELAATHSSLADALEACGASDQAMAEREQALALRELLAKDPAADDEDRRGLAMALEDAARGLTGQGRDLEVAEMRLRAVALWADLAPLSREDYDRWVVALNDLAWLLATTPDHATRDADRAILMAERATREAPQMASCWNTLGVARYRVGDEKGAVEALERSIQLGPPGGTAFDLLVLAMAFHRLGDIHGARDAYDRGVAWADRHRPGHPVLALFREEARELLHGRSGLPALADGR